MSMAFAIFTLCFPFKIRTFFAKIRMAFCYLLRGGFNNAKPKNET